MNKYFMWHLVGAGCIGVLMGTLDVWFDDYQLYVILAIQGASFVLGEKSK